MLQTCNISPLESAIECVRDVTTIGQDVQTALSALQDLEHCHNLPSLGGLMKARDGTVGSLAAEIGESPPSSGPSWCVTTSAISGDNGDGIGGER